MAVSMIGPKFYAWDRNGKPLAFGKLYTYQARTNVPKETYQSEDQVVANTNPVILNGEGYANIYLDGSYKMVLKDDKDNEIWSSDPVTSAKAEEWSNCLSATYINQTIVTVDGNHVSSYEVNRTVRVDNNTSVFSYSTVKSSSYGGGVTTIELNSPVVTTGVVGVCSSIVGPESTIGLNLRYTPVFSTVSNMANGVAIDGSEISFFNGQALKVNGEDGAVTHYTVVNSSSDVDLGGGLWAKKLKTLSRWDQAGFNASGPVDDAYNVIAGHSKNSIVSDTHSCVIAGGGILNRENVIGGVEANVNTGASNIPSTPILGLQAQFCVIGGGYDNVVNGLANAIPVGQHCLVSRNADHGTVTGGSVNWIMYGSYNAIYGGSRNTIYSDGYSVISGGGDGYIGTGLTYSTISGGSLNQIYDSFSTIAGGQSNVVQAGSPTSAIGGGSGNKTEQPNSTVAGGNGNNVKPTGQGGFIGGGISNIAAGQCAVIAGGRENQATKNYSQASGYQAEAKLAGQQAFANGKIFNIGDAQTSRLIMKGKTSGLQSVNMADLDGNVTLSTEANAAIGYRIRLVAHEVSGSNENGMIILEGVAHRGPSGLWSILKFTDQVLNTAALAGISARVFNDIGALRLEVTGVSGKSIQWLAYLDYTEVIG